MCFKFFNQNDLSHDLDLRLPSFHKLLKHRFKPTVRLVSQIKPYSRKGLFVVVVFLSKKKNENERLVVLWYLKLQKF